RFCRLERTPRRSHNRVAAASARLCREGGVPRRVRRAARARTAAAQALTGRPLRAAVDVAGERHCALPRTPALVQRTRAAARDRAAPRPTYPRQRFVIGVRRSPPTALGRN